MSDAGRHLPPGEIGEYLVKGPGVMNGYESNSEANGPAFHDGWFKTGDLGYSDDDGYLFLDASRKPSIAAGKRLRPRKWTHCFCATPRYWMPQPFRCPIPRSARTSLRRSCCDSP